MSSPTSLSSVRADAIARRDRGDLNSARVLLERALEAAAMTSGDDHPEVLTTAHLLAKMHRQAGDLSGARRVLENALFAGTHRHGEENPLLLSLTFDLAEIADELGNRHEARKHYTRIARFGPTAPGFDQHQVQAARAWLGISAPPADSVVPQQFPAIEPLPRRVPSTPPPPPRPLDEPIVATGPIVSDADGLGARLAASADAMTEQTSEMPHVARHAAPDLPTRHTPPPPMGPEPPRFVPPASEPPHDPDLASAWPHDTDAALAWQHDTEVPSTWPAPPEDAVPSWQAYETDAVPTYHREQDVASTPYEVGPAPAWQHDADVAQTWPHEADAAPTRPHEVDAAATWPVPREVDVAPEWPRQREVDAAPVLSPSAPTHFDSPAQPFAVPLRERVPSMPGRPIELPPPPPAPAPKRGRGVLIASLTAAFVAVVAAGITVFVVLHNPRTKSPEAAPSGPTGAATDVSLLDRGDRITLTWTDPSRGQAQPIVAGNRVDEAPRRMGVPAKGATETTLLSLNRNYDYCFTILLVYTVDDIRQSEQVCTNRKKASPSATE